MICVYVNDGYKQLDEIHYVGSLGFLSLKPLQH